MLTSTRAGQPRRAPITLLLLLAGCAGQVTQTHYSGTQWLDTNYVTFEHAFNERAEADARGRAEAQCRQLKRVAVQTSRACSLDRCTTSFQCMTPDEAERYLKGGSR